MPYYLFRWDSHWDKSGPRTRVAVVMLLLSKHYAICPVTSHIKRRTQDTTLILFFLARYVAVRYDVPLSMWRLRVAALLDFILREHAFSATKYKKITANNFLHTEEKQFSFRMSFVFVLICTSCTRRFIVEVKFRCGTRYSHWDGHHKAFITIIFLWRYQNGKPMAKQQQRCVIQA